MIDYIILTAIFYKYHYIFLASISVSTFQTVHGCEDQTLKLYNIDLYCIFTVSVYHTGGDIQMGDCWCCWIHVRCFCCLESSYTHKICRWEVVSNRCWNIPVAVGSCCSPQALLFHHNSRNKVSSLLTLLLCKNIADKGQSSFSSTTTFFQASKCII